MDLPLAFGFGDRVKGEPAALGHPRNLPNCEPTHGRSPFVYPFGSRGFFRSVRRGDTRQLATKARHLRKIDVTCRTTSTRGNALFHQRFCHLTD